MDTRHVAIIGGGLAGISAAWHLNKAGFRVTLFEARSRLGGRARSFREPHIGTEVDLCQHIALGCCTEFLRFCRELQLLSLFEPSRTLHFIDQVGRVHRFCASRWLPPPLHLLPAVTGLRFLSVKDRWKLLQGMHHLARGHSSAGQSTMGEWLRTNGQTTKLVEDFWTPVLISALSENVEDVPVAVARKVLVEGLMATRDGHQLWIPTLPLSSIFDDAVSRRLAEVGVIVAKGAVVRAISQNGAQLAVHLARGTRTFDGIVLAVPWRVALKILPAGWRESILPGWFERVHGSGQGMDACAITGIHLWFDRPCFSLPHAVLLGRRSQWVFRPGFSQKRENHGELGEVRTVPPNASEESWYCEIVVSASHRMPRMTPDEWVAMAVDDLKAVFPAAREARLLYGRVATEPAAVLSPREEWDRIRPPQMTAVPGLALAGDWTATGWPGTMESAVRSGIAAARALRSQLPSQS